MIAVIYWPVVTALYLGIIFLILGMILGLFGHLQAVYIFQLLS